MNVSIALTTLQVGVLVAELDEPLAAGTCICRECRRESKGLTGNCLSGGRADRGAERAAGGGRRGGASGRRAAPVPRLSRSAHPSFPCDSTSALPHNSRLSLNLEAGWTLEHSCLDCACRPATHKLELNSHDIRMAGCLSTLVTCRAGVPAVPGSAAGRAAEGT